MSDEMVSHHSDRQAPNVNSAFVGREREFNGLKASLSDAISGMGRIVTIAGEPGIGKTRMLQEIASHANSLNAKTYWGRCYEGSGAPPYWPWIQIIRSIIRDIGGDRLSSDFGSEISDIAQIVHEIRETVPELESLPSLQAEEARFRLFDSVSTFLRTVSQYHPIVLLVDNLHSADTPSLLLLEFVAQEITDSQILLLGTYRDTELSRTHPLMATLGQLTRQTNFLRMPLRGIDYEGVSRLVRDSLDVNAPERIIRELYNRSQGNPLFLTEMVRLLNEEYGVESESGEWEQNWISAVPEGVRDAIQGRLSKLSEKCYRTLTTASCIGREFELEFLSSVLTDISLDELIDILEEGIRENVIEEAPGEGFLYQFTHLLIQNTFSGDISTARRAQLHGIIGNSLEETLGDNVDSRATELAYHFGEARLIVGLQKYINYSQIAGENALNSYAYEEALTYFEKVLDEGNRLISDRQRADALFGLGRAQWSTLDWDGALINLKQAFDYFLKDGDIERAVAIAESTISPIPGRYRQTTSGEMILKALSEVDSGSHYASRLLSAYGRMLGNEWGDYEGAMDAFEKSLTIARRENDLNLEVQTLAHASFVDIFSYRWHENAEQNLRAIELAQRLGHLRAEADCQLNAARASYIVGDMKNAELHMNGALSVAEKLRERSYLSRVYATHEILFRIIGDWETARSISDRGLRVAPQDAPMLGYRALLEFQTGDFDSGEKYLGRMIDVARNTSYGWNIEYTTTAYILPIVFRIKGTMGELDLANSAIESVLQSKDANFAAYAHASLGASILAVLQDDKEAAARYYEALNRLEGLITLTGVFSFDRLLGLLTHTMGQLEQSSTHFENGIKFCRNAGYKPELAWTCCDYAEMLLSNNSVSNKEKVVNLLDEAKSISDELGMSPLANRVTEIRSEIGDVETPEQSNPSNLTKREMEILLLISDGKSNREISDELVISINTVLRHVSNIFSKTASANRTEAAIYAREQGLVS